MTDPGPGTVGQAEAGGPWVRVAALEDLEPCRAYRFTVRGEPVCVVRVEGSEVHAIGDTCTHQDVSLSEGEVLCAEREVECWKHGSTFSLIDGTPQCLPATRPTPVYAVRVTDDGAVLIGPRRDA